MNNAKLRWLVTAGFLALFVAVPIYAAPSNLEGQGGSVIFDQFIEEVRFEIMSVNSPEENVVAVDLFDNVPGWQSMLSEVFQMAAGEKLVVDYVATQCPSLSCYIFIGSDHDVLVQRTIILKAGAEPRDYPTIFLDNNEFTPISGTMIPGTALVTGHTKVSQTGTSQSPAEIAQAPAYSITIRTGSTVSWLRDQGIHSVTADDGTFDTGVPSDDWVVFNQTFDEAGQFSYYCKVHGAAGGFGMAGIVNVIGADDPGPGFDNFVLLPFMHK